MPNTIRIPVSGLRRGDVLLPTNREVVSASAGLRTPPGKYDVWLRRAEPEGNDENRVSHHVFGKRTMITVVR